LISPSSGWSTQQLAEFLVAVSAYEDEASAIRCAVEWAAEAVEAEVAAMVRGGRLAAAVGFAQGEAPVADLVALTERPRGIIEVPGAGACQVLVIPVDDDPASHLVIGRSGDGGFDAEESALLRAMARCLVLTLRTLRTLESERTLRAVMARAQEALLESERTFRLLFANNPHPMWVTDRDTFDFLAVNDAAVDLYGYSRDQFLTMRVTDLRWPAESARLAAAMQRMEQGERVVDRIQHRLKDGRLIQVEVTVRSHEFSGRPATLVLAQDITERTALEEQLRHQAFHDPLTGLANRALWRDRAEHAIALCLRDPTPLAVLAIDLDGFKAVNDTLGHPAGDRILVGVSERLTACLRPGDTPAHLGGDEFAVLLEDTAAEEAVRVAERILEELRAPFSVAGKEVFVGASIGIAVTTDAAADGDALLRDADIAMYAAKMRGKGRAELFEPAMHRGTVRRLELGSQLRRALERDELLLEYQPVVSLATGAVETVEALVRWRHPAHGLVLPGEFIPLAEETGLIVPVGRWVLETACRQLCRWRSADPDGPHLSVAVNVSSRQLREPGFENTVTDVLAATGLHPSSLTLEVTESVLVDDMEAVSERLDMLRKLGVRIAMDDFGAGYSSLAYLRKLPLDIVKIDRMFVAGLASCVDDRSLTLAIVRLLDTLDVATVAEGIESAEQLDYVRALGIDAGQGYFFSRPLPAERLGCPPWSAASLGLLRPVSR
jgi:diguanylate cyclase (GGDEF)-like protein/PAS domain S-box-containing protein